MKVVSKDYIAINSSLQRLGIPQRSKLARYLFSLFFDGATLVKKGEVEKALGIKFREGASKSGIKRSLSDFQFTELREILRQAGLISVHVDPNSEYGNMGLWKPGNSIVRAINKKKSEESVLVTVEEVNHRFRRLEKLIKGEDPGEPYSELEKLLKGKIESK